MESEKFLREALLEIEEWEKDQKSIWFWEKIGRIPFKILDKITPSFIQKKIGLMLDELGNFIQNGGNYLTNDKLIIKNVDNHYPDQKIQSINDIQQVPLSVMDHVSEELKKTRRNAATAQGATTGIGGIFTLAIDIPILLGMTLKTLQEIAITYGYDPSDRKERIFIVKCLQFTSADIVGKQAILNELSSYYKEENEPKEMIAQLQGWREVVYSYRDSFGWKKLFQMVPVAGIIFGAFTNRSMMHDIAETGIMLYRKRRIHERLNDMAKEE
ncbi:EcsC family protein [Bacillus solimangrovi]|uniref:EcsC family protein n=1 Tax=Bacillus solimangrovi TaxID=1305675 RepID=A0A1E5LC52_9BACI|nr:EcsC family protein [Bacillus solimangrovi]OEH91678.1 hypothetical protein BFG57_04175 [Bacillus solimangrovi]